MVDKDTVLAQYRKINVLMLDVGGSEPFSLLVARCLGEVPGVTVHVVALSPWLPVRFSRWIGAYRVLADGANEEQHLATIKEAAKRVRADILLPVEEGAIRLIDRHADGLRTVCALAPMPPVDALDRAGDKWSLSSVLHQTRLLAPETLLFENNEQFVRSLDTMKFPILLKPRGWWGGRGTRRFDDRASLDPFLDRNRHLASHYLVQEFVEGRDAGCNILCCDGEILTYTLQRGYLPPTSPFGTPAGVEFFEDAKILQSVALLAKALSWSGVANIDLRLSDQDGSPHFLEINPRFWRSLLASLAAGVNFPYLTCLIGMGVPVKHIPYTPTRFVVESRVALRRLMLRRSGKHVVNNSGEHTPLRYIKKDPLPEVFTVLRAALARPAPESMRNREWQSRSSPL